jgi:hypothetical protein
MIVFLSEMIMIKEMTGGGSPVPELFTSQTSVTLKRLGPSEKRRLEDLLAVLPFFKLFFFPEVNTNVDI